ncbi:hypothetical protein [Corynebacterium marquesiae]|uniref:hypothetical protein n=1 Tax=Corynebacterium marquesiae TaxID=2913503 RepID=UPI0038D19FAD
MDAYGNFFSDWYDKFMEDQNELLVKLAKGTTSDFLTGKPSSADLFKNVPTKWDSIMDMPSQHELMENLLGNYKWPSLPPSITGNVAGQAMEEMSGSVLAALNPDIQKLNRELMGMSSAHPAIKGIVDRAVELSTMQGQADTETAPEDDEVPSAVEEFVENNPEEARTIAEELRHIVLQSTGKPKEWWSGLSAIEQCRVMFECGQFMFNSGIASATMPGGVITGTYLAGQIVISMVAIVFISWESNGNKGD